MATARRGAAATADDQLLTLGEVKALLANAGALTGEVRALAGSTVPSGWLAADGSAVSRTTYASLYTAIGTAHGTGDGSTTFNLPDLRGRVVAGVSAVASDPFQILGAKPGEQTHLLSVNEMPSHNHLNSGHQHTGTTANAGGHNHSISNDGNHSHGGGTNGSGTGIYTGGAGNHSHSPSSGTGFLIYNGTSVTRSRFASGTTGGYAFQTATQSDLIFGGTSNPGDHTHGIGDPGHSHGINGDGTHSHGGGTGSVGDHSHTFTTNSSTDSISSTGGGAAHNVIQPSIALTYIIKT